MVDSLRPKEEGVPSKPDVSQWRRKVDRRGSGVVRGGGGRPRCPGGARGMDRWRNAKTLVRCQAEPTAD